MKEMILERAIQLTSSKLIYNFLDVFLIPIFVLLVLFLLYFLLKFIFKKIIENKYHKKLASSGIADIDKMDGLQFEFYLQALFKELGFKSEVTNGSHDYGADLIMKKDNKRIVIQAKRYKYKSNVGVEAVQQTYTAIPFYKADEGWIITNSFYTKNAKVLGKVCNIKMLDRFKLIDFINEVNPTILPEEVKRTIKPKERKCSLCGEKLILRNSKTGNQFMGCSNYPTCKNTESIAN